MASNAPTDFPQEPTLEQKIKYKANQRRREIFRQRGRACIVRKQLIEAYEILDRISLKTIGDSVPRGYIDQSKYYIEKALSDFMFEDDYHKDRVDKTKKMTDEEIYEELNSDSGMACSDHPKGCPEGSHTN